MSPDVPGLYRMDSVSRNNEETIRRESRNHIRELIEKDKPQKVLFDQWPVCPNCLYAGFDTVMVAVHEHNSTEWAPKYCPECGQRLDWEE